MNCRELRFGFPLVSVPRSDEWKVCRIGVAELFLFPLPLRL